MCEKNVLWITTPAPRFLIQLCFLSHTLLFSNITTRSVSQPLSNPYYKKQTDTPTLNNPKHASITECQKALGATQTAVFARV